MRSGWLLTGDAGGGGSLGRWSSSVPSHAGSSFRRGSPDRRWNVRGGVAVRGRARRRRHPGGRRSRRGRVRVGRTSPWRRWGRRGSPAGCWRIHAQRGVVSDGRQLTVRFEERPSDADLRDLERVADVRVVRRNEYVDSQVSVAPVGTGGVYLPHLCDEILGRDGVVAAWLNTRSHYSKE